MAYEETESSIKGATIMPVIKKPFEHFNVVTYTGNGSTQTIDVGFQPDFVWVKQRNGTAFHALFDSVRGATLTLQSNTTTAEQTFSTALTAFTSNGFTTGSSTDTNQSGQSYVAWAWKANGSAVTNTAGSITSQVSANASAGFSVVTYTGTGSAGATVGNGLGVAPKMVIVKSRGIVSPNYGWQVQHASLGATKFIVLNSTGASVTSSGMWNDTAPTSSVFSLGNDWDVNKSATTYVAYCFSAVAGYSAFGSYVGNGSTDGTFIHVGFRPRFIMLKRTDSTGNWTMYDSARNTYNAGSYPLYPNLSNAEDASTDHFDWLSNGFKMRSTNQNASGGSYIYMAFASNPFKHSLGV